MVAKRARFKFVQKLLKLVFLKNELFKWFIANKEEKANKYNVFLEDIIKKDGSKRNWLHITKRQFPSYKEGGTRVFKP